MSTVTPYRSDLRPGRDGFAQLLRAEWTKFRTVRGWVAGTVVTALLIMGLGLLFATGSHSSCMKGPVEVPCPAPILGPGGEAVRDRFYFVHQPLDGDGSITVRVNSMTGQIRKPDATPGVRNVVTGVVPWAKAGVMIKESTEQGAPYAAVMMTGSHGVRMQHNFTKDVAGRPGGVSAQSPRWLRLTRTGDAITGEESPDGRQWTRVGTARLAGLPTQARIGLFAASPGDLTVTRNTIGGSTAASRFTEATAVLDEVGVRGTGTGGTWKIDDIGVTTGLDGVTPHHPGRLERSGGTFTITGVGDIAPITEEGTVERTLTGTMFGLIVVIVVAVLFVTAEYRRQLIRTTLLASPRRGRVLAAKAVVIGTVTFVAGLAATAVTLPIGRQVLRGNNIYTLPVSALTELRVVAGVAALLAVAAIFALALGSLFRRSAMAVIVAIAAILVPYVLATASILPESVSDWLLRVTPAAGFAIQQSIPEYPQVTAHYAPVAGYYPLAPWAGFAVTCGYAALALALAVHRLRRSDV
ncbi:ABC transporter permease subunit [Nonomuraea turcica]|uniref:ABC transporter permease subunit n=1 Tax=Nonomuraea sp. G32 TaxID=3067274 RepID=UPI00273CCBB8|nr:ABC transporter permease subunit [Nonomuraea sp. G32]MDP4505652.1 ABC transporter permease subunit [Nonomuraea sp. G32]